ncbi:MAG TPA: antitoxin [Candidatus Dormibacteraeota bacterium]|jgi:hypothetical protein
MQRAQLYLTEEQRAGLARRSLDDGVSVAEVVRRILDRALGIRSGADDRLAMIDTTAGILPDAPDWPEWLAQVRGLGSDARLRDLGL